MSVATLKCLSSTTTSIKYHSCHQPQTVSTATHKCTCKKLNIMSSASSAEKYMIPLQIRFGINPNQEIATSYDKKYKPERLQTAPLTTTTISCDELSRAQLSRAQPNHTFFTSQFQPSINSCHPYDEQFYSCSSEDSESEEKPEKFPESRELDKSDTNCIILEFLQEVVQLINKDDHRRKDVMCITEVAPSSLDKSTSRMTPQESEIKIKDKISKPTSTTHLASLAWPPHPCFGYCPAHVAAFNFPYIQPYNVISSAHNPQVCQPVLYQQTDSFKDCCSGSGSIPTADETPVHLSGICSSVHGQMETEMITPTSCSSLAESANVEIDFSTQADVTLCSQGLEISFDNKTEPKSVSKCPSSNNKKLPDNLPCLCSCMPGPKTPYYYPAESKNTETDLLVQQVVNPCPEIDCNEMLVPTSLPVEEYTDEELHPSYVDKIFTEPFAIYTPSPYCLMEYDDEEPILAELVDELAIEQLDPTEMYQPCQDCLSQYDDEEPSYTREEIILEGKAIAEPEQIIETEDHDGPPEQIEFAAEEEVDLQQIIEPEEVVKSQVLAESKELIESEEFTEPQANEILDKISSADPEASSFEKIPDYSSIAVTIKAEESANVMEQIDATAPLNEETGQDLYNFFPETDKPDDSRRLIAYESEQEYDSSCHEEELAKEKISENRKRKKADDNELTLTKFTERPGSSPEMKFFIDSLILDLEAMEYARRKSQFEKNICKPKVAACARDSFPVTITDVTDLGANSLYVKWKIHDCFGIGGYEIYTDGYLTNRYYSSRHDAAVITQVDITLPHKIALVAQPCANDESLDLICNMSQNKSKLKSLPWKTTLVGRERRSCLDLWTPSIFLYDPIGTPVPPPLVRDNF